MSRKKLTDHEYLKAVSDLNMSDQNKKIGYGVLVEGKAQVEFARKYKISKSSVSLSIHRIYRAYEDSLKSEGYERIDVVLPAHSAFIVRKWAKEAEKRMEESEI